MHLVFLNQYYPPDVAPTGVVLRDVAEALAARGHAVTILCVEGGYAGGVKESVVLGPLSMVEKEAETLARKLSDNGQRTTDIRQPAPRVLRIGATKYGRGTFVGKLTDYASYYLGVAWKLMTLHPRPDRIIALTTPPYLSVLARLISKFRGADHAHWVMDLYPDVMAAHGMLGERSPVYRILARLARWGFGGRRCAAVLTLGPDMAGRVGKYVEEFTEMALRTRREAEEIGGGVSNSQRSSVQWVPLWGGEGDVERRTSNVERRTSNIERRTLNVEEGIPGREDRTLNVEEGGAGIRHSASHISHSISLRRKRGWGDNELIVMYSGNMGLGHRFGEVLAVAEEERRTSNVERRTLSVDHSFSKGRCLPEEMGELSEVGVRLSETDLKFEFKPDEENGTTGRMPAPRGPGILPGAEIHEIPYSSDGLSVVADGADVPGVASAMAEDSDHRRFTCISDDGQRTTANSSSIRFVFFGGGKRRGEIASFIAAHPEVAVELHDYAPADILVEHLQSADVHLVSLDPEWTGTMVPSKLQGIFEIGRPVIFIGSEVSSIGRWVRDSGGGWVVRPGDVAGLLAAIDEARDSELRSARGQAARAYGKVHFRRDVNVSRVAGLFEGISMNNCPKV